MKDIKGFEGIYAVTEDGRVWNEKYKRWLKPSTDVMGYKAVGLFRNSTTYTRRVHRLVAEAYIPNPEKLPQVNHKNGIKTDNRVDNLEWCTASHNLFHAHATGLLKNARGQDSATAKLSDDDVREIRRLLNQGIRQAKIMEKFGICRTTVYVIASGRGWDHVQ